MEVKKNSQENSNKIRLNRFLAQCGLGSRRDCDKLIESGHIYCNGKKVTSLGVKIDPEVDKIEYRGKNIKPIYKLEYFVYYKPREVIVSTFDPEGRKTIYEDLESKGKNLKHLKYAGRLDYQSEGLLLLTNDGSLIHALTHPRYKIKKVYHVKVQKLLTDKEIKTLLNGVLSEGEMINADEIKLLTSHSEERKQFWYEIVLY
ncbi:MAG: pseudouridine synthase, partial [Chitinispirillaceae bacterium]|nr:pseudouridine synthase [Chitinispirillaceae bacterium]